MAEADGDKRPSKPGSSGCSERAPTLGRRRPLRGAGRRQAQPRAGTLRGARDRRAGRHRRHGAGRAGRLQRRDRQSPGLVQPLGRRYWPRLGSCPALAGSLVRACPFAGEVIWIPVALAALAQGYAVVRGIREIWNHVRAQREEKVRRITASDITARKGKVPVVCLTAYSAPMAEVLDDHCDLAAGRRLGRHGGAWPCPTPSA